MKKRFKKIVKMEWGDYWMLFTNVNLFFAVMSYLLKIIDIPFHYIPISISLIATIFIIPFFEVKKDIYYQEV